MKTPTSMGLTGVIMCARGLTGSADYRARVNRPNEIGGRAEEDAPPISQNPLRVMAANSPQPAPFLIEWRAPPSQFSSLSG
jgi:hypothetical protein